MKRITIRNGRRNSDKITGDAKRKHPALLAAIEALETRCLLSTTYTVTTALDSGPGSLRAAINSATLDGAADIINFDASLTASGPATINLTTIGDTSFGPSDFAITTNITIQGPTGSNGITLANSGNQRLFYVSPAGNLSLDNVTISGGNVVGATGGPSNGPSGAGGGGAGLGGAVYDDGGTFSAQGCTFTNNSATGGTGGIAQGGSGAGPGGGGPGFGGGGAGAVFDTGHAGGFGGGGGGGGAPQSAQDGHLNGGNGGFGAGDGGVGGSSGGGGGGGAGLGGGVFSNGGTLTLTNDTFYNNKAVAGRGAPQNAGGGLYGFDGSGYGGAVFALNGTVNVTFVTLSGNTAADGATDVYILSDKNDAGVRGGGTTSAGLVNDILGQSGTGPSDFTAGTHSGGTPASITANNDLVTNNPGTGALTGTNISSSVDPQLGASGYYGGPTKTLPISVSGPELGAGIAVNGITADQRGALRPAPPDIGAFQYNYNLVVNTTADNVNDANVSGLTVTLREAVNFADASAGNAAITFDPTVFATPQTITLSSTFGLLELSQTGGSTTITGPAAGVTVSGNKAVGVFQVDAGVTAILAGLTIANGNASVAGGGIYNDGTLTLTNDTITTSGAGTGAGIYNDADGNLTVTNSTISNNATTGNSGGGVYNAGGTVTMTGDTVSGNTGGQGGGGIAGSNGTLSITNSTIYNNSSPDNGGGGISQLGGSITLMNDTISGNSTAFGLGGGIDSTASILATNTIIAGNTDQGGSGDAEAGFDKNSIYNIIGDGSESSGITDGKNGNQIGASTTHTSLIDPLLGPLTTNGGPTLTMALLSGSPAINAGDPNYLADTTNPLTTDQRGTGFSRISGGLIDIGAFEYQYTVPTVQFSAASETVNASAGTFSITVTQSGAVPVNTSIPFTLGGTAVSGTDYNGVTASPLVIPAGQTSGTISGTLLSDQGNSSTLTFTLGTPTNATLGTTTSNTLNITQATQIQSQAVEDDNSIDVSEQAVGTSTTVTSATTASGNVLANDKNLAADPSTVTKISDAKNPSGVTPAGNGTITIDGGYGTLVVQTTGPNAGNYSYSLDSGAVPPVSAVDTFTYTLTDGHGNSSTANVVVTLDVTQTQLPVSQAVEDDNSIDVGEQVVGTSTTVTSATTATGNLLVNDKNLSGDPSTISKITDAKNPGGVTPVSGVSTIDGAYGTLVVQTTGPNAGNYTYSLDSAAVPPVNAVDTFTYAIVDAYGNSSSANVVMTLNVTQTQIPVSQAVEDDNSINVSEQVVGSSTTVTSATTATGNLLVNDKNLATDPSTITKITDAKSPSGVTPNVNGVITIDGTYGTLVVQTTGPGAGNYTYSLDNAVVPPVNATDTFTYALTDGYGNSSTANFIVALDVTVQQSTLSITTSAQPGSARVGAWIADQATLSGGNNPGGKVTFKLYSNSTATGTPLYTDTETLSHGSATSKGYNIATAGTVYWVDTYLGDANNSSVTSGAASEPVHISAGNAAIAIKPYSVIYDSSAHTATGIAIGVGGVNLSADLNFSGTIHTNAGTYSTDHWTFHDPSGNYQDASGTITDRIGQATPTISVTDGGVYTGSPFNATGSVTGVGNANLDTPTFKYFLASDSKFKNPLSGAPTNVGSYVVVASYAGGGNYAAASKTVSFSITGISPVFSNLSGPTIFYHTNSTTLSGKIAAGSLIPTGGVSITLHGVSQTATIKPDGTFSSSFSTKSLAAGTYTVFYAFAASNNFAGATATSTLRVTYNIGGSSLGTFKAGSTIAASFVVQDINGQDVNYTATSATATGIARASSPNTILPLPAGSSTGGKFSADSDQDEYSLNLKTTGLTAGTYLLYFTISGDPITHSLTFVIK